MAPHTWHNVDHRAFFAIHMPEFILRRGQAKLYKFWGPMYEAWFHTFPEQGFLGWALPGPDAPSLTAEEHTVLGAAIVARKKKLENYFRNNSTKVQTGSAKHQKSELGLARALFHAKPARERVHKASEIFQIRNNALIRRECEREGYNEFDGEAMSKTNDNWVNEDDEVTVARTKEAAAIRMRIRTRVVNALFAEASDEELAAIADVIEREKAGEIVRASEDEEVTRTPAEYQASIEESWEVIKKVHKIVEEKTGWYGMTIWGGPNPRLGGALSMKCVSFGLSPAGNDFEASHASFDTSVTTPFQQHLKRCFPLSVRQERALGPSIHGTAEDEPIDPFFRVPEEVAAQEAQHAKPKRMKKPKKKLPAGTATGPATISAAPSPPAGVDPAPFAPIDVMNSQLLSMPDIDDTSTVPPATLPTALAAGAPIDDPSSTLVPMYIDEDPFMGMGDFFPSNEFTPPSDDSWLTQSGSSYDKPPSTPRTSSSASSSTHAWMDQGESRSGGSSPDMSLILPRGTLRPVNPSPTPHTFPPVLPPPAPRACFQGAAFAINRTLSPRTAAPGGNARMGELLSSFRRHTESRPALNPSSTPSQIPFASTPLRNPFASTPTRGPTNAAKRLSALLCTSAVPPAATPTVPAPSPVPSMIPPATSFPRSRPMANDPAPVIARRKAMLKPKGIAAPKSKPPPAKAKAAVKAAASKAKSKAAVVRVDKVDEMQAEATAPAGPLIDTSNTGTEEGHCEYDPKNNNRNRLREEKRKEKAAREAARNAPGAARRRAEALAPNVLSFVNDPPPIVLAPLRSKRARKPTEKDGEVVELPRKLTRAAIQQRANEKSEAALLARHKKQKKA
ncbi:hypothetical protein C8R44DRAFT_889516 [Mycena epipterygia]|nr:hypothetical protein C8R44DRAFT_889516 [Mycena epipterygia]